MAPTQQIRPWRHLGVFTAIVVVLYALVFLTGDRQPLPKLGIDLQGGTQVTLTARTPNGQPPTRDQLVQARQIINDRVNGLGISGAQVIQNGANLVITVPGDQGRQAKDLAQTALLRIRPVIDGPIQSPPPGQPGASAPGAPGRSGSGSGGPGGTPGPGSAAPHGHFTLPEAPKPPPPPVPPGGSVASDTQMETQIALAKGLRQNPALVTNATVRKQALDKLQCGGRDILSGYDDPTQPLVTCDPKSHEKYVLAPTLLEGTQIANASSGRNDQGVGYIVNLTFDGPGTRTWGDFTSQNVGKLAAFVLDGEVVSAPQINGAIVGGATKIEGNFSQAEAQHLAGVLKYGSLPLSFATSDARTVSATLGLASLEAGLIAGAIGLALVFVYCLFYYRALGVLTILSLALSGAIVYAVLVLLGRAIGFTLDLSGVAGFIVSIGITADSFVIYFERLKDEVREGRSFRSAVPRGWARARRTILTADAVSFLASAVLYILAIGDVRGFAFTLGMSTILDLVVVFLVTHPLVAMASNSRLFSSPAWSGLGAVARIGAQKRRAAAAAAAAARGA
ncbi:MAG TPA: protein translocase subunit SecD [Pseudonocardia sp.]|nr:protein translocase subunit SecD [Pseudonocardia sp.]